MEQLLYIHGAVSWINKPYAEEWWRLPFARKNCTAVSWHPPHLHICTSFFLSKIQIWAISSLSIPWFLSHPNSNCTIHRTTILAFNKLAYTLCHKSSHRHAIVVTGNSSISGPIAHSVSHDNPKLHQTRNLTFTSLAYTLWHTIHIDMEILVPWNSSISRPKGHLVSRDNYKLHQIRRLAFNRLA